MADEGLRPIIVKRIKKTAAGHHGGAWKIAYADFVTPLKVAMSGGSGSGDSALILQGGGKDLTARAGQVKHGDTAAQKKTYDLKAARLALAKEEAARLNQLKAKLEATIDADPLLKKYKKQLLLDITSEGLRIQIVDEQNRPMFALAKAELQPYTRDILHVIGIVLNEVPNKIGLSGHTDSSQYLRDTGYSNWELSSERANASRRELIIGGMDEKKILRVVGLASAANLDRKDPFNPINRRISIIVMNKKTEEMVMRDNASQTIADAPAEDDDAPAAVPAAKPAAGGVAK